MSSDKFIIQAKKICKHFYQGGNRIPVLQDFNLQVKPSEIISIVGPSGSGKTTLLSLLAGLEPPDKGSIYIDNHDIVNMTESQLAHFRAQNIGIVFQQFHLMPHLTALENVMLPLEITHASKVKSKAMDVLRKINLEPRFNHLPSQMSGGECQRVAIARALIAHPKVIFADEPSGNLDKDSAQVAIDMLFKLVKESQTSLILVTHNERLAAQCERQVHILGKDQ